MGPFIGERDHRHSKEIWKKFFDASVDSIADWYGISREETLNLVSEKMDLGYVGYALFEAVRADLESRKTKILERV